MLNLCDKYSLLKCIDRESDVEIQAPMYSECFFIIRQNIHTHTHTHTHTYIYICIYISLSSSSHAYSTESLESLLLFVPIIHHFRLVLLTESNIYIESIYVSFCWSANTYVSMPSSPLRECHLWVHLYFSSSAKHVLWDRG